jgi:hypothetical protein
LFFFASRFENSRRTAAIPAQLTQSIARLEKALSTAAELTL